jgi:hypothetical protein
MERAVKSEIILHEACPRLGIGLTLSKQTWEVHIKPFHPIAEEHLPLIKSVIRNCDEQQPVWYKRNQPDRMCIVKQVVNFLPANKFILIAFKKYSEKMGCITSIYPVDELPEKEKGYILL